MLQEIQVESSLEKENELEDAKNYEESNETKKNDDHANTPDSKEKIPHFQDRKFFTDEIPNYEPDKELKFDHDDLVHVIKILHGSKREKEFKVEEIYEKEKKHISKRNSLGVKRHNPDSNGFSSTNKTKHKTPFSSKSYSNSKTFMEKSKSCFNKNRSSSVLHTPGKIPCSRTETNFNRGSGNKLNVGIRPYMLDAKSRRKIKDYEHYLYKTNSFISRQKKKFCACQDKVSGNKNSSSFELKFLSQQFSKTSDSSVPETPKNSDSDSLTGLGIREKFQTVPKEKKEDENCDGRTDKFSGEYRNLLSAQKKSTKNRSVFDILKGDERDLPSIYSRFVRKSKGVSKKENDESKRFEKILDHIEGEQVNEKTIHDEHLELIERNPYKFEKKIREVAKVQKKILENFEVREEKGIEKKKKKTETQMNRVEKLAKKSLKTEKGKENNSNMSRKLTNRKKTKINNSKDDVVKENLNMSPTATITMMMLAADKLTARKSEFFSRNRDRK